MPATTEAKSPVAANGAQVFTDAEFSAFQQMIFAVAGIHMPASKKTMVAGRLSKRLKALQMSSYGAYWQHLRRDAAEKQTAVDQIGRAHV